MINRLCVDCTSLAVYSWDEVSEKSEVGPIDVRVWDEPPSNLKLLEQNKRETQIYEWQDACSPISAYANKYLLAISCLPT